MEARAAAAHCANQHGGGSLCYVWTPCVSSGERMWVCPALALHAACSLGLGWQRC